MTDKFFRTRIGQHFFEATKSKVADQFERLNANHEALLVEIGRECRRPEETVSAAKPDNPSTETDRGTP